MHNHTFLCMCAVVAIGCGGGSVSVSNSVSGTLGGKTFQAADAIVNTQVGSGFDFNGPAAYLQITDFAGVCDLEAKRQDPTSGQRIVLGLGVKDAAGKSSPPTAPATFTLVASASSVTNANVAEFYYQAGCFKQAAIYNGSASGTVTVTSVGAGGALEGTFDLTVSGSKVTGSFRAAPCAAANVNASGACI